jgi:hypothetical protein
MGTRACVWKLVRKLSFVLTASLFLVVWSAPAQNLTLNPASVDFGSQPVGAATSPASVTLTNNSATQSFTIVSIYSTAGPFSVSGPSLPVTLLPGQNLTMLVTFTPQAAQSLSGQFGFTTYHGWKFTVPLAGTGTPAQSASSSGTTSSAACSTSSVPTSGASSSATSSPTTGTSAGTMTGSSASSSPAATPAPPSVALAWAPSVSQNVLGYNVYRGSVSGGPYTLLTPSPIVSTSYVDANVSSSQKFYYVVTTVAAGNVESSDSSEVSATIP